MSTLSVRRFEPIVIEGHVYGHVVGNEFKVSRHYKHLYRNCFCEEHDRCPGFTVSRQALELAEKAGAIFVKVEFKPSKEIKHMETYVTSIAKLKGAAVTLDNRGFPQYSLALHNFVKIE